LHGSVVIAKRCPAPIASIERHIYETLLPRLSVPALRFYGLAPEPGGEFSWLFLDDAGPHEYRWELAEHRALAGHWLGMLQSINGLAELQALLPDRSPEHYFNLLCGVRRWLVANAGNPLLSGEEKSLIRTVATQCDLIDAHWDEVQRLLERVPRTLVHGDFVNKNLRVLPGATGPALMVFDWEMAGWGIPATDLAHVDRCARPDLDTYRSALRQDRPHLNVQDVRRLADYGSLLRIVDQIAWTALTMKGDTYRFLISPLSRIERYQPLLAEALRALDWSSQD
jgi:hypothetical protein